MKVGDKVRYRDPCGSYGTVTYVDDADGDVMVLWCYGKDVNGNFVTERSNRLAINRLMPVEERFYFKYTSFRAWSDEQKEFEKNPTYTAPNEGKRSVLQDWVHGLTFMQQSVLITATRGPDGIRKDHPVKVLLRYLRRSYLICAFDGKVRWSPYEPGGGSFTGPLNLKGTGEGEGHIDKYVEIYLRHVDELPHHFQLHLMHAAEILGYKHPDGDVRGFWRALYLAIVNDAHLQPEPEEVMDRRLGDYEKHWRDAEGGVTAK